MDRCTDRRKDGRKMSNIIADQLLAAMATNNCASNANDYFCLRYYIELIALIFVQLLVV